MWLPQRYVMDKFRDTGCKWACWSRSMLEHHELVSVGHDLWKKLCITHLDRRLGTRRGNWTCKLKCWPQSEAPSEFWTQKRENSPLKARSKLHCLKWCWSEGRRGKSHTTRGFFQKNGDSACFLGHPTPFSPSSDHCGSQIIALDLGKSHD